MPDQSIQRQELLAEQITGGTRTLSALTRRLRRTNAGLLISGVISSAVSTLITGVTAAQGPIVGTGTEGWRMACMAGAIFSFGTTISVGLNQRLKLGERLAETKQCTGRLRALEIALTTGSRDWQTIAKEYEEIIRAYPDLIS